MKTIYKYSVQPFTDFITEMHKGAEILSVQVQNFELSDHRTTSQPMMWALVNTDEPIVKRQFLMLTTGNLIHEKHFMNESILGKYVGTFQTSTMVFHLFDKGEI